VPIEPGSQLLHYRLIEQIGEGGMGVVWKAADTSLNREVAIKILPEIVASDADRLARFEREAHLLASLNHPNIAAVYGLHEHEGLRFIAMELVPSEDLAARLERGPLPLELALATASKVADALDAAHERGVIHRDLKPANVTLAEDGTVKVLDFGLAKAFDTGDASGSPSMSPTITSAGTMAGTLMGTAAYMSPEQAKGKTVDRSADVWSFGVMLHEMLTAKQLFARETISETLASVLMSEVDVEGLPAETPRAIRALIDRCLIKDSRKRLRDIREARLVLEDPNAASLASGAVASVTDTAPAASASRLPWILVGLMAAAMMLVQWGPWREAPEPASPRHLRVQTVADLPLFSFSYGAAAIFSPDGSKYAFISGDATNRELYVNDLDRLEPKAISGTEGAYHPFFSPDGEWIGFVTRTQLKKVSAFGGTPVVIADVSLGRGATWSSDDTIIYAPSPNSGLLRIAASGGEPEVVTELAEGEYTHRWPSLLPDGRGMLFTAHDMGSDFNEARIELFAFESGERTVLHHGGQYARYVDNGHIVYAREGTLYALPFDLGAQEVLGPPFPVLEGVTTGSANGGAQYSVSRSGDLIYYHGVTAVEAEAIRVTRDGEEAPIAATTAVQGSLRYSPDGKQIAVQQDLQIWLIDNERGTRSRLTFSDMADWSPVWSPDGKQIAFASTRSGVGDIYIKAADGSEDAVALFQSDRQVTPTDWSRDGRTIAINRQSGKTGMDIAMLDVETGEVHDWLATRAQEIGPQFFPDGEWVVYASEESGEFEIYVQRFPKPGGKQQVSTGGGFTPQVAADGSKIFYLTVDAVMEVPVRKEGSRLVIGQPQKVVRIDSSASQTRIFAVSPDGEEFIYRRTATDAATASQLSHVNIVFDWFADESWERGRR
jgi:serine/threonine-protein kinase